MKTYFLQIDGKTVRFNAADGCLTPAPCPVKDLDNDDVGFIGGSFVCHLCQNWGGLDVPNLFKE